MEKNNKKRTTKASKIVCVGVGRTGSTSMGKAFKILGYKTTGCNSHFWRNMVYNRYLEDIYETIDHYDAFHDRPWRSLYKYIDQKFPGSKFVYTYRDMTECAKSYWRKFRKTELLHLDCDDKEAPDWYIRARRRELRDREQKILKYFDGYDEDFLRFNVWAGDGWEKLCRFLNKPIPDVPFPHEHRSR